MSAIIKGRLLPNLRHVLHNVPVLICHFYSEACLSQSYYVLWARHVRGSALDGGSVLVVVSECEDTRQPNESPGWYFRFACGSFGSHVAHSVRLWLIRFVCGSFALHVAHSGRWTCNCAPNCSNAWIEQSLRSIILCWISIFPSRVGKNSNIYSIYPNICLSCWIILYFYHAYTPPPPTRNVIWQIRH